MTVLAIARGDTWTAMVADAVKGRTTKNGIKFDVLTDKIIAIKETYFAAVGDGVAFLALCRVSAWRDPHALDIEDENTFNDLIKAANTIRRSFVLKSPGVSIPRQGFTLVSISSCHAVWRQVEFDNNEYCSNTPCVVIQPGDAVLFYGRKPVQLGAPTKQTEAIESLKQSTVAHDEKIRGDSTQPTLPYALRDLWSTVLCAATSQPVRSLPFSSLDELLENEHELTEECLEVTEG